MQGRLEIFIESGCDNCREAISMAKQVRRQMPAAQISLIDLVQEPHRRPNQVFAVPTYLLDGKVLSLGNPRLQDLLAALNEQTATPADEVEEYGKSKNARADPN